MQDRLSRANGPGYEQAVEGIEINGDVKVTVAEFVQFDRQMSEKMPREGKQPPPPKP